MATRSYPQTTIKVLFGLCGNQCAEPSCTNPIIAPGTPYSDEAVIGQICHIYALSDDGPRGNPAMAEEERNAPANPILLCPTHHVVVDTQYDTYPATLLIDWKKRHEAKFNPETAEVARREADLQKHAFFARVSDVEIGRALDRRRQARFLAGFDARQEALRRAELSSGSKDVRARAHAWCARILSTGDTLSTAQTLLKKSRELAATAEGDIAEAFVLAAADRPAALASLARQSSPQAR